MIRVLHVLNNLGSGGAESLLMNVYRKIDKSKLQFDFLIRSDKNGPIVDEIISMGGHVYQIADYPKHFFKNRKELKIFFKNHSEYDIIHVHANSLIYVKPLFAAKRAGISCRIIHSHNVNTAGTFPFLKQIHSINKKRINKIVTHRFACSKPAGKWMFGENSFEIIDNGIDLGRYSFDPVKRIQLREKYNIQKSFVIGNVGRFSPQKNHSFIIRLFAKYIEVNPNARLMLVGEGELLGEIQELAKQLGVFDKIDFIGAVSNVEDYLSAMDVFLFPSIYEGLGMSFIEAQAIGLPCVVSSNVPPEAFYNKNCKCLSLDGSMDDWINALKSCGERQESSDALLKYDINRVAKKLENFYLENSISGRYK